MSHLTPRGNILRVNHMLCSVRDRLINLLSSTHMPWEKESRMKIDAMLSPRFNLTNPLTSKQLLVSRTRQNALSTQTLMAYYQDRYINHYSLPITLKQFHLMKRLPFATWSPSLNDFAGDGVLECEKSVSFCCQGQKTLSFWRNPNMKLSSSTSCIPTFRLM